MLGPRPNRRGQRPAVSTASRRPRLRNAMLFVALLTPSFAGHGGDLGQSLQQMFFAASTSTSAGSFESQTRMGWVGGSYNMGTAARNVQLLHFSPPRLEMGCGGIDAFMGSFSMISGEQFKQVVKQIGSAAAGYFLKLALETMCPACNKILDTLQQFANVVNQSNINSCRVARGLVNDMWNAAGLAEKKDQKTQSSMTTDSFVSDFSAAISSFTSMFSRQEGERNVGTNNPDAYNLVWRLLITGNATGTSQPTLMGFNPGDPDLAELIMSMTGTVINNDTPEVNCSTENCAGASNVYRPRIGFVDFYEGTGQRNIAGDAARNKFRWKCTDNPGVMDASTEKACQAMSEIPFEWGGVRSWVHSWLFGSGDLNNVTPTADSVVGKVLAKQAILAGTPQAHFVALSSLPIYSAMRQAKEPATVISLAQEFRDLLARDIAIGLVDGIIDTISRPVTTTKVSAPPDWDKTVANLRKEMNDFRPKPQEIIQANLTVREYLTVANRASGIGLLYTIPGGRQ